MPARGRLVVRFAGGDAIHRDIAAILGTVVVLMLFGTAPALAATTFVQVAAGQFHTCAIVSDGSVQCWGKNARGQLGDGTTRASAVPVTVAGITSAKAISAGESETCAVLASGAVRCWGWNDGGRLGDGTTEASSTPVEVHGIAGATAVSVGGGATGGGHVCALLKAGGIRCWGRNTNGQLGDGSTEDRALPVAVGGITTAAGVSAGGGHTCAVLRAGSIRCWGSNVDGRLGDGGTRPRATPVAVSGITTATAVSAGGGHTCARLSDATVSCWGSNDDGQLGNGSLESSRTPVPVPGLTGVAVLDAGGGGAGGAHTCAAPAAGPAQCWGYGAFGQLGDGLRETRDTPAPVSDARFNTVGLSAGAGHTCAVLSNGRVSCWGLGADGEIGDRASVDRDVPVEVTEGGALPPTGATPVSGTVLVRLAGSSRFVPLAPGQQLPSGSEVDVTRGVIRITPPGQNGDSALFYGGRFVYRQRRERGKLVAELTLSEPLTCPKGAGAAARPLKRRHLWGDGKGGFRTRGKRASAGVRGTRWLTADTCTLTRVRVARGVVTVRDLGRRRTVILRAGQSYTARGRR